MNDSLSIIVPVHNAEAVLPQQIERLLEMLPDLTNRFEILVVDDGSTDQTVELARELACEYPQLRLIRHAQPRGTDLAIKTGLQWAQGLTVLVQDDTASLSPTDLQRLWSLRQDHTAPLQPRVIDASLLERLTTWGQALRSLGHSIGGMHLVRRAASTASHAAEKELDVIAARSLPSGDHSRADGSHLLTGLRRPKASFLEHLRELVVGE